MTRLVEDRKLLSEFRAGGPGALRVVYDHYAEEVFRFVSRGFSYHSGDQLLRFQGMGLSFETEDCIHEIFLRAFSEEARLAYDGLRPYRSYLLGIARNLIIDRLRKENLVRRRERPLTEETLQQAAEPAVDPDEKILADQIERQVQAFTRGLGALERRIFERRVVQGRSVEEAARELQVSEYRIKRTEKHLKVALLEVMRRAGLLEHVTVASLPASLGWLVAVLTI